MGQLCIFFRTSSLVCVGLLALAHLSGVHGEREKAKSLKNDHLAILNKASLEPVSKGHADLAKPRQPRETIKIEEHDFKLELLDAKERGLKVELQHGQDDKKIDLPLSLLQLDKQDAVAVPDSPEGGEQQVSTIEFRREHVAGASLALTVESREKSSHSRMKAAESYSCASSSRSAANASSDDLQGGLSNLSNHREVASSLSSDGLKEIRLNETNVALRQIRTDFKKTSHTSNASRFIERDVHSDVQDGGWTGLGLGIVFMILLVLFFLLVRCFLRFARNVASDAVGSRPQRTLNNQENVASRFVRKTEVEQSMNAWQVSGAFEGSRSIKFSSSPDEIVPTEPEKRKRNSLDASPLSTLSTQPESWGEKDGNRQDTKTSTESIPDLSINIKRKTATFSLPDFHIQGADGQDRAFKWMFSRDATVVGLPAGHSSFDNASTKRIPAPWSAVGLQSICATRGLLKIESWTAQSVEQLLQELNTGQATLLQVGDDLLRTVEVVLVIVCREGGDTKDVLVSDVPNDFGDDVPSVLKTFNETIADAAERCVDLNVSEHIPVTLLLEQVTTVEEQEHSGAFPELVTIVRKHLVVGFVPQEDDSTPHSSFADVVAKATEAKGNPGSKLKQAVKSLMESKTAGFGCQWKSLARVGSLLKHRSLLKAVLARNRESNSPATEPKPAYGTRTLDRHGSRTLDGQFSILQGHARKIVLPWNPDEVDKLLQAHRVTPETYGTSLEDLSNKASLGLVYFVKLAPSASSSKGTSSCQAGEELFLARDVVLLRVESEHCRAVLVEKMDETAVRWPQTVRMAHESIWETARVMLRQQLELRGDPPLLDLGFELQEVDINVTDLLPAGQQRGVIDRQWLVTAQIPLGSEAQLCSINPPRSSREA